MSEEIKPCAHCGRKAEFPEAKDVYGTCYEVWCRGCGVPSIDIQIIDCFDYPRDHVHESWSEENIQYGIEYIEVARQEAIKDWNMRYIPDGFALVKVDLLQSVCVHTNRIINDQDVDCTVNLEFAIEQLQELITAYQEGK